MTFEAPTNSNVNASNFSNTFDIVKRCTNIQSKKPKHCIVKSKMIKNINSLLFFKIITNESTLFNLYYHYAEFLFRFCIASD